MFYTRLQFKKENKMKSIVYVALTAMVFAGCVENVNGAAPVGGAAPAVAPGAPAGRLTVTDIIEVRPGESIPRYKVPYQGHAVGDPFFDGSDEDRGLEATFQVLHSRGLNLMIPKYMPDGGNIRDFKKYMIKLKDELREGDSGTTLKDKLGRLKQLPHKVLLDKVNFALQGRGAVHGERGYNYMIHQEKTDKAQAVKASVKNITQYIQECGSILLEANQVIARFNLDKRNGRATVARAEVVQSLENVVEWMRALRVELASANTELNQNIAAVGDDGTTVDILVQQKESIKNLGRIIGTTFNSLAALLKEHYGEEVSIYFAYTMLVSLLDYTFAQAGEFTVELNAYAGDEIKVGEKTLIDRLNDWTEKQFGERMFTVEWLRNYDGNPDKAKILSERTAAVRDLATRQAG